MRPTLALAVLGLPALALAAVRGASASKLDEFKALARKNNGIVKLDSEAYDVITASPRDYSVSIVLTAMAPQYKCAPCHLMAPEHALVAKQWASQSRKEDEEHIFAVLDFADGNAVYQRLGLSTAPTFQLFLPTEGSRASAKTGPETYDFGRSGFKAEAIANYMRGTAKIPISFSRPVDKGKVISMLAAVTAFLCALWRAWPYLRFIFSATIVWAFLTISIILLMTSGYMWNQIRHPPYVQPAQGDRVNYIAGGYSNQLGAETHIVAAVYAILAFSAYTLSSILPKVRDPVKQRLGVYVWTGISLVMLGVLMNLFKIKQGGYPFKLF